MNCLKNILKLKVLMLCKVLSETNNNKEKNNKLVDTFNSGLKDLENEIKKYV